MRKIYLAIIALLISVGSFSQQISKIELDATKLKTRINRNIYGHFSEHLGHCIYGGLYVGDTSSIPNIHGLRKDVIDAFKNIKMPLLRWPGGCFADEYHWKDGIGNKNTRPSMINTNWGGVTEDNSFGTHEFLEFCKLVGCEPYLSGNLGSGTVQEMSQWVEYVNSDNVSPMTKIRKQNGQEKSWGVKYWGIGNESWGCGGNMKPDYYTNLARQYNSFCKDYGKNRLYRIASGPNSDDYNWTEVVMRNMGTSISGLSLHYYTWGEGETAINFTPKQWFNTMKKTLYMDELVTKHSAIMDKYDPAKSISLCVDEWGTWFAVEPGTNPGFLYQQSTLRDALVAGTNLNIFNNHADRVKMANIAQVANVLQSIIITDKDKMVLTPTYYVFDMYKVHQNAMLVSSKVESPQFMFDNQGIAAINASASIDQDGKMHVTICNTDLYNEYKTHCTIKGFIPKHLTGTILNDKEMNAHNTFENPNVLNIRPFTDFSIESSQVEVTIPAKSVIAIEITGEMPKKEPLKLANPKQGLTYKYFEGNWNRLPNFDLLEPKLTGEIESFKYPEKPSSDYFGLDFNGYIKIEKEGFYNLYTSSDDGSMLYIDDDVIINNDGLHGEIEVGSALFLSQGYHKIRVTFFEAGAGDLLHVRMDGQGMEKQEIPAQMLWH